MCWADANAAPDMWNVASSLRTRGCPVLTSLIRVQLATYLDFFFLHVIPPLSAEFLVFFYCYKNRH